MELGKQLVRRKSIGNTRTGKQDTQRVLQAPDTPYFVKIFDRGEDEILLSGKPREILRTGSGAYQNGKERIGSTGKTATRPPLQVLPKEMAEKEKEKNSGSQGKGNRTNKGAGMGGERVAVSR